MRKKLLFVLLSAAVLCAVLAAVFLNSGKSSSGFEADAFTLIGGRPYILSGGSAYYLNTENEWDPYETEDALTRLFRGDYFCALTEEGLILFEPDISPEEADAFPLGSAHTFFMAERLSALSLEKPILTLNRSPALEDCRALCRDGTLLLNSEEDYFSFTLPDETIKDISGEYVLTESGRVYRIQAADSHSPSCQKISDGPVVLISASETGSGCVGVYEDGSAVMWSDQKPLDLSEWQDVTEVTTGFNYCAGLTSRGEILYADYNGERRALVTDLLKSKTPEHIACSYQTLALLNADGSVEIIDLEKIR